MNEKLTALENTGIFKERSGYGARLTVRHADTGRVTYRATLHRDSHDDQSYVHVEVWNYQSPGWITISHKTAQELSLPRLSEKDWLPAFVTLQDELDLAIRIASMLA